MQTFPFLYFDVRYANTFDGIICFVLGLCVIIELGKKLGAGFGATIVSVVIYLFINPQVVNISPVYSTSLLILGLLYATCLLQKQLIDKQQYQIDLKVTVIASIPVALFYSALSTLKATILIFLILFFLLNLLGGFIFLKPISRVIKTNLTIVVVSLFLIMSWLLAPSTKYFSFISKHFSHSDTISQVNINPVSRLD